MFTKYLFLNNNAVPLQLHNMMWILESSMADLETELQILNSKMLAHMWNRLWCILQSLGFASGNWDERADKERRNDSGKGGERTKAFLEHDATWTTNYPDNELAAVSQNSPMSSQPPERSDSQTLHLFCSQIYYKLHYWAQSTEENVH